MMKTYDESTDYAREGWLPESHPESGFEVWNDLQSYNEDDQRETTTQPLVVPWSIFEKRVAEQKKLRDTLRDQGFCFWPWVIARHFGIDWLDFNQGNRGSCAACSTNNAVNAMLLTHLADGYRFKYKRFNPYPTWELGKRDANYHGEGASLSMMLTCANKRGMFDVEKVGTYNQSLQTPPRYTEEFFEDAEKCQIGACYLGDFRGQELASIVFDCLAAGYPVVFGNSVAVSQNVRYEGKIKTAINSGGWMHATARVAWRKENGVEYIAHQGSWGKYWETGKYESEPASIIWENLDTFSQACNGRYTDAFAICMLEGEIIENDDHNIAPVRIERK
ncbi:MAG: hypothetical protein FWC50_12275 [Planctomycetaceae bacterium]|nr:hypothetical protein [Planctomycetaceae bacterium]